MGPVAHPVGAATGHRGPPGHQLAAAPLGEPDSQDPDHETGYDERPKGAAHLLPGERQVGHVRFSMSPTLPRLVSVAPPWAPPGIPSYPRAHRLPSTLPTPRPRPDSGAVPFIVPDNPIKYIAKGEAEAEVTQAKMAKAFRCGGRTHALNSLHRSDLTVSNLIAVGIFSTEESVRT